MNILLNEPIQVEELIDRYGQTRFDCVEILNLQVGELPTSGSFDSLLTKFLPGTPVVLLASGGHFLNVVEVADQAGVAVKMSYAGREMGACCQKGKITQTIDFSYPFLRTLPPREVFRMALERSSTGH